MMYADDHPPAHFHALFAEHRADRMRESQNRYQQNRSASIGSGRPTA